MHLLRAQQAEQMMNDPEFKDEIQRYMASLRTDPAFQQAMLTAQEKFQELMKHAAFSALECGTLRYTLRSCEWSFLQCACLCSCGYCAPCTVQRYSRLLSSARHAALQDPAKLEQLQGQYSQLAGMSGAGGAN
eukprot:5294-Heterococcus_DN1.PRE.1